MANISDISFNVGISISEETVYRCCRLLEIYLQDHPDLTLKAEGAKMYGSDEYRVSVYITEKPTGEKGTE